MRLRFSRPETRKSDALQVFSIMALVLVVAVAVVARLPQRAFPRQICTFHRVTGRPCLTCGGTRAAVALGRLDPVTAFKKNPLVAALLLLAAPFGLWGILAWCYRWPRPRLEFASAWGRWAWRMGLAALVVANWAYLIVAKV